MKKIIIAALVILCLLLGCGGYHFYKVKNDMARHIASDIYENVSDLNTHIKNLQNGMASKEAMDREELCMEIAARQIYSDFNALKVIYPKQEFKLYEIISGYVHLTDVKIYGLDRYRAMELLEKLNEYLAMYSECDLHSDKGSYHTLLLRDEYITEKINEHGLNNYNNLKLEIMSVR